MMANNLFEQAKEMVANLTNMNQNGQGGHAPNASDKEAARKAIQAAYNDATPEQKKQLDQFEQQLDERINLHS